MHEKLSHLSTQQIEDLMRRYYEKNEKVDALVREFKIDIASSNLVKTFPPKNHTDTPCPYGCSPFMISARVSRSSYAFNKSPFCPICKHTNSDYCSCNNCREQARARQKQIDLEEENTNIKKREIITQQYSVHEARNFPEDVSVKDALYLLALSRHSISEDFGTIDPFALTNPPFAPTFDFQNQIVRHLFAAGYIAIGNDSDITAFIFDDELTEAEQYYPTQVTWSFLPGHNISDKKQFLKDVEAMVENDGWAQEICDELAELWHLIGKYECIELYDYQLRKRGFEIEKFGDKTHSTFEKLLTQFSVSQVFNLTWQSVRDVNDYISSEGIPLYRGKNMFVGAIQRKGEKAIAEGWSIKSSRRDFNCPQTVVSSTFFDLFLGRGQQYMEEVPLELTT